MASAVGDVPSGRWLRGLGWRSGEWSPAAEPTKEALDAVTGDVPAALMSKDYHSLWLNSAALALADGELQVPGGVVERDERGEPDRRPPGGVRLALPATPTSDRRRTRWSRPAARASRSRSPGGSSPSMTRTAGSGALRVFQRLREEGALSLRVWQSLPWEHLDRLEGIGLASGPR